MVSHRPLIIYNSKFAIKSERSVFLKLRNRAFFSVEIASSLLSLQ